MKKKRKPSTRYFVMDAYMAYAVPHITAVGDKLHKMDHTVARAAVRAFGTYTSAAKWLTTPLKELRGIPPIDCRKKEVLQVLGRLEHGVFG